MIDKHHNYEYYSGVPLPAGDRYYSQDLLRDFWYAIDRIGHILKDQVIDIPYIISGGVVTKGTGDTLNITAGIGYCKFSVTVPNSYASTPPTTQSQDIESIRTEWTAQTNMAIGSAVLDGATTNYVKVRYNDSNGNSRNRAKKAGSYVFEKTPSFTIVVDNTPNTDYDILLDTFTGTGGGAFTFSGLQSPKKGKVLEVDDANYTVLDTDGFEEIVFINLTADRSLNLPTLADNPWRKITITNLGDGYSVNCNPEGSEDINNWNYKFEITEEGGKVEFLALSDRWKATPLNDACILSVESESADTGLALDGTWDDVDGMTLLNGVYGKGFLDAFGNHYGYDDSFPERIHLNFGIGKTSGNNAPDIFFTEDSQVYLTGDYMKILEIKEVINNFPYESDGSPIYMKAMIYTDELSATSHNMYGATDCPMSIRWRRVY